MITTAVEHAAVGQPAERLEQMGYEVTIVPVDHRGVVQSGGIKEGASSRYDSGIYYVCE